MILWKVEINKHILDLLPGPAPSWTIWASYGRGDELVYWCKIRSNYSSYYSIQIRNFRNEAYSALSESAIFRLIYQIITLANGWRSKFQLHKLFKGCKKGPYATRDRPKLNAWLVRGAWSMMHVTRGSLCMISSSRELFVAFRGIQ